MMSTYLGSITIVLKLPFTSAASANGLDRYSGFAPAPPGDGVRGSIEPEELVRVMGAGERPERGARLRLNTWHTVINRSVPLNDTELRTQRTTWVVEIRGI
jgi:hypothetical protein